MGKYYIAAVNMAAGQIDIRFMEEPDEFAYQGLFDNHFIVVVDFDDIVNTEVKLCQLLDQRCPQWREFLN